MLRFALTIAASLAFSATVQGVERFTPAYYRVELGKDTTYISSPLADDGFPNYALALLKREAQGVTPENNGALLFWQGMGPVGIDTEDFARLCGKIGLDPATCHAAYDGPGSEAFDSKISAWLSSTASDPAQETDERRAEAYVIEAMQSTPWSDADIPPAAEWLADNHARLDLIVAAANKPRFFSPSPDALNDPTTAVLELDLSHLQRMRDVSRGLLTRAMHRIDAENFVGAWQDIVACWKLGAHASNGSSPINLLMAVAIRKRAGDATIVLLSRQDLPLQILEQVASDLEVYSPPSALASILDFGERACALDFVLRIHTNRLGGLDAEICRDVGPIRLMPAHLSALLRTQNESIDRLVEVARISGLSKRWKERKQTFQELNDAYQTLKANGMANFHDLNSSTHFVAAALAYYQLDSLKAAFSAIDRDEVRYVLLRIAAELALHRARTGAYPESLVDMSPRKIDAIPLDPYTSEPFHYARRNDGYILYSAFENGKDDGGTDSAGEVVAGEWLPYGEQGDVEYSESDVVVRSPRPEFARSEGHR